MLAGIALSIATGILIKRGQLRYAWVTAAPLLWLMIVTTTATWQKIVSPDIRIGFLQQPISWPTDSPPGTLSENRSESHRS